MRRPTTRASHRGTTALLPRPVAPSPLDRERHRNLSDHGCHTPRRENQRTTPALRVAASRRERSCCQRRELTRKRGQPLLAGGGLEARGTHAVPRRCAACTSGGELHAPWRVVKRPVPSPHPDRTSIPRCLDLPLTKHTILFLAANPVGTDRLALDE